jgi:hypothetical protein
MEVKHIIPSPSEAAAMRNAIAETMAGILFERSAFDLEAAFSTLAASGFPQPMIRELAETAIERAMARATRH